MTVLSGFTGGFTASLITFHETSESRIYKVVFTAASVDSGFNQVRIDVPAMLLAAPIVQNVGATFGAALNHGVLGQVSAFAATSGDQAGEIFHEATGQLLVSIDNANVAAVAGGQWAGEVSAARNDILVTLP
jgi:hypothetical protein